MKIRDKKFLTNDELRYVLSGVQSGTDEFSKEMLKVGLVAQIIIEDVNWDEYDTCNDVYDAVMENDIDLYELKNYYIIDEILKKENSVEKVVERFLNELSDKIDEYSKSVDLTQMEGLVNEFKKVVGGSEEEIKVEG